MLFIIKQVCIKTNIRMYINTHPNVFTKYSLLFYLFTSKPSRKFSLSHLLKF